MTPRVLLVVGEGRHEIGPTEGAVDPSSPLPALPGLTHRLLGELPEISYSVGLFRQITHVRGYKKKVQAAMRKARNEGAIGVAVVVDRDGPENTSRLGELQQGRNEMPPTLGVPCAVGLAVESFDAWMIVDAAAMSATAGGAAAIAHPAPESLTPEQAKRYASEQLGDGLGQRYASVAAKTDLSLLRRQCPKGFAPFAQELEQRILPGLATSPSASQE